ncbi:G-protein coupled receptor 135-like [Mercenaria mercenaria]|uniref:G-protein coupled receptor 135-like n=1 Tax=Mercenaria mercenaria TaxID=6596 RepID=UPI00234F4E8A|nr:G-protein coupled receptor 135-like [Mercenaria mercenaria]
MTETNTTSITCEYRANYTCWKESADEFNRKWANLMIPVEIMMCLFMIAGTLGNVLVLVVYSYRRHKTTANIFIMYLAGIDLTACVVLHPYIIFKLFNNYDQTWTGVCKCFEYFIHCSLTLSGFMLFLVAVDRYLAICRPVKFLLFDKHVVKLIASMTVASVIISLPILEFYGATPEVSEFSSSFTGYKCHLRKQYQNSALLTAFGAFIMCGFLFEIILLAGLYKNVAVTAYRSRRVVPALSNAHVLAGIKPSSSNTDTQTSFLNRGPNSSGISSLSAQQNPQQNGPSFDGVFRNRNRENK